MFKKTFTVKECVHSAVLRISGLGMYEAYINGKKVHDTYFEPGESVYEKTVYYNVFNVGSLIKKGKNDIVVWIGNGFYHNEKNTDDRLNRAPEIIGERMLACQLEILTAYDMTVIESDESWLCSDSPVVSSNWLGGEVYDDNVVPCWSSHAQFAKKPLFRMKRKEYPSVIEYEKIMSVSAKILENGNTLIDFGKNFAGTYIFSAKAPRGTRINFYFSEVLNDDGTVNQKDFWGKIYDTYIFGNSENISYTPKFVYHGFRYIEIEGLCVDVSNFIGIRLHCGNKRISYLKTDNKTVNKIHRIISNSLEDNMQSVITDCPHREKLGWTEVYQLLFSTYAFNFDLKDYYKKLLFDLADAQREDGSIPSIVPPFTKGIKVHALRQGKDDTPNDPSWCGAIILAAYEYYRFYGDRDILQQLYPYMQKYLSYISSLSVNHLLPVENLNRKLGDWMSCDSPDVTFILSSVYYRLYDTMSKIAEIINADNIFENEKHLIKNEINTAYFNGRYYDNNSQSANAVALAYGICAKKNEAAVFDSLLNSVIKNDCRLTVGEVALKPLFDMLCKFGKGNIAYKVLINAYSDFTKSKTTLPESWDGRFSQNHAMLGVGDSFFFEHLAGISYSAGFEKIMLNPYFPDDINAFSLDLKTPEGQINISWERKEEGICYLCNHDKNICVIFNGDCIFSENIL